jgi:beta-D-xylosidase 4
MDVGPLKADPRVSALIWAGYPGMMGGKALAQIMYGDVQPSGKLPYSMYSQETLSTVNPMRIDMRPDPADGYPGRTYRFYAGRTPPVYTFGDGLTYEPFGVQLPQTPAKVADVADCRAPMSGNGFAAILSQYIAAHSSTQAAALGVRRGPVILQQPAVITHLGAESRASRTVLAFLIPPGAGTQGRPLKFMVGFEKVLLDAGESATVSFNVTARDLTLVGPTGVREVVLGKWRLSVEGEEVSFCI